MQSIELVAPRYGIAWYPWAVQYFFLVALSYSSLWLALPGVITGRERWLPASRLALVGALSTAIVAPVSLLADLHQPLRFWHFYAYPHTSSWMSLGSFFLPVYVGLVVALAWLIWRDPLKSWHNEKGLQGFVARIAPLGQWTTPRWLVIVTALAAFVFSLGVMGYTGAEIAILKGRPLWHTEYLPAMFLLTGVIGAAGLVILLNRFSWVRNPRAGDQMLAVILVASVLTGLAVAGWLAQGLALNEGSVAEAIRSIRGSAQWRDIAYWSFSAGILLFLGAGLMVVLGSLRGTRWILGLLALHVAWMFRWTVLMDVQTVARNTAGFENYVVSTGSQGLMGIIGSFGLWIALLLIIDLFVPWRAAFTPPGPRDRTSLDKSPTEQTTAHETAAPKGEPHYG